jgi:hypothetical protein
MNDAKLQTGAAMVKARLTRELQCELNSFCEQQPAADLLFLHDLLLNVITHPHEQSDCLIADYAAFALGK